MNEKQTINHSQELPTLLLRSVEGFGDFKTKEIHLESKGYTIKEAQEGLKDLIRKLKEI